MFDLKKCILYIFILSNLSVRSKEFQSSNDNKTIYKFTYLTNLINSSV